MPNTATDGPQPTPIPSVLARIAHIRQRDRHAVYRAETRTCGRGRSFRADAEHRDVRHVGHADELENGEDALSNDVAAHGHLPRCGVVSFRAVSTAARSRPPENSPATTPPEPKPTSCTIRDRRGAEHAQRRAVRVRGQEDIVRRRGCGDDGIVEGVYRGFVWRCVLW